MTVEERLTELRRWRHDGGKMGVNTQKLTSLKDARHTDGKETLNHELNLQYLKEK